MKEFIYRKGDVFLADLGIPHGSEQGGRRPVVVIQNDDGCIWSPTVTMVPMTTAIKKPFQKSHYMEELFGDFSYAIAFSRNHMKVKDGKSERPRFHVYFQIEEITDEKVYAGLKIAIQKQYTFFDDNALDAARFIFGADTGEVIWHEGWMTIDEEISPVVETDEPEKQEGKSSGPILQGSRNNTMSRFASRILKRYGDTEKAHVAFMEHAEKCDPPLPEAELNTIWKRGPVLRRKVLCNQ